MQDYLTYIGKGSNIGNTKTGRSYSIYRVIDKVYDLLPRLDILVTKGSSASLSLEVASIPLPT